MQCKAFFVFPRRLIRQSRSRSDFVHDADAHPVRVLGFLQKSSEGRNLSLVQQRAQQLLMVVVSPRDRLHQNPAVPQQSATTKQRIPRRKGSEDVAHFETRTSHARRFASVVPGDNDNSPASVVSRTNRSPVC